MKLKTCVVGASENPERYSHKAILLLQSYGHPVCAIGARAGTVNGVPIQTQLIEDSDIHTITLYINPSIQEKYIQWILDRKPQRVIFNPGTENPDMYILLEQSGIECVEACTLVLLRTGQYA